MKFPVSECDAADGSCDDHRRHVYNHWYVDEPPRRGHRLRYGSTFASAMFDFVLPVAIVGGVAIFVFSVAIAARRLLPDRIAANGGYYAARFSTAQLFVTEGRWFAPMANTLSEVLARKQTVRCALTRSSVANRCFLAKLPSVVKLQPGDQPVRKGLAGQSETFRAGFLALRFITCQRQSNTPSTIRVSAGRRKVSRSQKSL